MKLLSFIRLIYNYKYHLLLVPIAMALMVMYFTRGEVRSYSSSTVVYTGIASGYSIESQDNSRVDFFAINNAFDNLINIIKSRETLEEVSMRLLSEHLVLEKPDSGIILKSNFTKLKKDIPPNIWKLMVKGSVEKTFLNLDKFKSSNNNNFLYFLINSKHGHYGIENIAKVNVKRIANSDLIELTFESDDPGICSQTLKILTSVFNNNYALIKKTQTNDVVSYFEGQLKESSKRLKQAEDELLNFNKDNKIINYYEQTKYIASQKEALDMEYEQEKMRFTGAKFVLLRLEGEFTQKDKVKLNNTSIIDKRNSISAISSKIAILQTENFLDSVEMSASKKEEVRKLELQRSKLKNELADAIDNVFNYENSQYGLAIMKVLDEWLINTITFEESKAKMDVLITRKREFIKVYDLYAPLGATIKRIEREINVEEQQYLSLLHSLAQAKLKQQNIEMSSSLRVVDAPYFPINPKASKRKLMIVLAGMVGLVFTLFLIILLEYFDNTIKTIKRAKEFTGLEMVGIVNNFNQGRNDYNLDMLEKKVMDLNLQQIYLKSQQILHNKPFTILFFSTQEKEGKSFLIQKLASLMNEQQYPTLYLTYDQISPTENSVQFEVDKNYFHLENINQLIHNYTDRKIENFDFVFVEIPEIIYTLYPIQLVKSFDLVFQIISSRRKWTEADANALKNLLTICNTKPYFILNGVNLIELEPFIGELPRKRSVFKKFIKKIMTGRYFEKTFNDKFKF